MSYRRRRHQKKPAQAARAVSAMEAQAPELAAPPVQAPAGQTPAKRAPGKASSGKASSGKSASDKPGAGRPAAARGDGRFSIRGLPASILRVAVVAIIAVNAVFAPPYRLLLGWAAHLHLMRRFEAFVEGLNPYAILAVLTAPFAFAEPAKFFALYLFARGDWVSGAVVMTLAYVVSLVVLERGYRAGRAKLLTIGWFATLAEFVGRTRDAVYAFARESRAYAFYMETKARLVPFTREAYARISAFWRILRAKFAR